MQDIEVAQNLVLGSLIAAALGATLVPLIYARTYWFRSMLGRLFMMQAISFALALDCTVLFRFWEYPIMVTLFLNAWVFTMICISTTAMTVFIWKLNYTEKEGRHERRNNKL